MRDGTLANRHCVGRDIVPRACDFFGPTVLSVGAQTELSSRLSRRAVGPKRRDLLFFSPAVLSMEAPLSPLSSRAGASTIGKGSASRHRRRRLIALIALFAHFYLQNHPDDGLSGKRARIISDRLDVRTFRDRNEAASTPALPPQPEKPQLPHPCKMINLIA
jgi:hypothetical protein